MRENQAGGFYTKVEWAAMLRVWGRVRGSREELRVCEKSGRGRFLCQDRKAAMLRL